MSKTTEDPTKYYRTGIAITLERKAIFEQRLKELGMKTVGDLVTMFILSECIVETLKPLMERYREDIANKKAVRKTKNGMLDALKRMSPEELTALLDLSRQAKAEPQTDQQGK
jgi:hypothetical protein